MNTKLLVGIIVAVVIAVVFVVLFIVIHKKTKSKKITFKIIVACLSLIGEICNIIFLILPGYQALTFEINDYNSNDSFVVGHNSGVVVHENNGQVNIENHYSNENNPKLENSFMYHVVDDFVVGWFDSNGGRSSYTIAEINNGILGDKITFNSISDSVIGHEFNFVGAKENLPKDKIKPYYNGNEIEAKENSTYIVRLYAHNNSPKGYDGIAKNVKEMFYISDTYKVLNNDLETKEKKYDKGYYAVSVHGFVKSSNSIPKEVSDGVKFYSSKPFELEYVPGTAILENNGIGKNQYPLDDNITKQYVSIGYNKLNGQIPGCFGFSSYTTILVKPIF